MAAKKNLNDANTDFGQPYPLNLDRVDVGLTSDEREQLHEDLLADTGSADGIRAEAEATPEPEPVEVVMVLSEPVVDSAGREIQYPVPA